MSQVTAPDSNDYIDRIHLILSKSALVLPKTNGSTTEADLVKQIIKYELPLPEQPIQGLGPPHIYVSVSRTPVVGTKTIGRGNRNAVSRRIYTLEFYAVVVVKGPDPLDSQKEMYTIVQAIETTLEKNKRLTDPTTGLLPIAAKLETFQVPYLLQTDQADIKATNVVIRPQVYVNLV